MDTQTKILEHLDLVDTGTVQQLSHALGLTKADIRYHLKTLIRDHMVSQVPESLQEGPGRPAAQFCLIIRPPVRLYSSILDTILDILYLDSLPKEVEHHLADAVVSSLLTGIEDSSSPAVRLSKRIEHLSTLGFRIRWEAGSNGPVIHIQKEPITAAIKNQRFSELILSNLKKQINKKSLA